MLDRLRRSFNYTTMVRLNGALFRIPVIAGVEVRGVRTTFKTHIIRRFARGGVFIDVGANLGQTLLDLRASHPAMRYIGFEPNPRAVTYIHRLIRANAFSDANVVCAALADRVATLRLFSVPHDEADPSSTLRSEQWPNGEHSSAQPVAVLPFDLIADSLDARPLGFVKIDAEGAELEVLRGMQRYLRQDRPPILCEVLPPCGGASRQESEARRQALMELIASLDYTVTHVNTDATLTPAREFSAGPYSPQQSWDYLFLPAEYDSSHTT